MASVIADIIGVIIKQTPDGVKNKIAFYGKKLFLSLIDIPKWLGYLLLVTIAIGGSYFMFQNMQTDDINQL